MKSTQEYYKLNPIDICDNVNSLDKESLISEVEEISLSIHPHVYPSHKFRSTAFMLRNLKEIVKGKIVCDMGCGPGIVGLYSVHHGAKQVVQADINPHAVENAKQNNIRHGFSDPKIRTFLSDCFDSLPNIYFDIIVFPMPYHCDEIEIDDPLKYAFYDPDFRSISKFLDQARKFSHKDTQILISFSNKGNCPRLEAIFEKSGYKWELWKVINTEQAFDNRIYSLNLG